MLHNKIYFVFVPLTVIYNVNVAHFLYMYFTVVKKYFHCNLINNAYNNTGHLNEFNCYFIFVSKLYVASCYLRRNLLTSIFQYCKMFEDLKFDTSSI